MAQTTPAPALPAGAVELPRDPKNPDKPAWVVLGSMEELDFGFAQDVLSTIKTGAAAGQSAVDMRAAILGELVRNWSYEHLPLPATAATLRRLPLEAGLALYKEIKPVYDMINGLGTKVVVSKGAVDDEASPTTGSSAS